MNEACATCNHVIPLHNQQDQDLLMLAGDYVRRADSFIARDVVLHHFKTKTAISSKLC